MSAGGPGLGGGAVGWLNTKQFRETLDGVKSQGWTPLVIDTNGNGKRDAYVEPKEPLDPNKDKRIMASFYGIMPSPVDDAIWGQAMDRGFSRIDQPGYIVRVMPGPIPSILRWWKCISRRRAHSARAASISASTAWCGRCFLADIWRASTASCARGR